MVALCVTEERPLYFYFIVLSLSPNTLSPRGTDIIIYNSKIPTTNVWGVAFVLPTPQTARGLLSGGLMSGGLMSYSLLRRRCTDFLETLPHDV